MASEELVPHEPPVVPEQLTLESVLPQEVVAPITDVRGRAIPLIRALDFLGKVNARDLFVRAQTEPKVRQELIERMGVEKFEEDAPKARKSRYNFQKATRTEFRMAYEVGMGPIDTPEKEAEFTSAFGTFYTSFEGSGNKVARHTYLKSLHSQDKLKGEAPGGDIYTLEPEPAEARTQQIEPLLNKQEKLDIFESDPRLQFHPATNKEEEQARRALNYIDDPHGVLVMLNEIDAKSYKEARKKGMSDARARQVGDVARQSVLREFGDHLSNALHQVTYLNELESLIGGLNPNLTLTEALDGTHPALGALCRELDYQAFRKNHASLGFDPLLTRQDRAPQSNPDKHKTIEDRYTGEMEDQMITERLATWASKVTLRELVQSRIITSTKAAQENRAKFWEYRVLRQTDGADKRVAKSILEELQVTAS